MSTLKTYENYKTLMKEIEGDRNKWKDRLYSWIRRISIKIIILPEAIYEFSITPVEIPKRLFTEIEKTILKFVYNRKDPE